MTSPDAESERRHPARVVLHGGVEEGFDAGEGDDLVEFAVDFLAPHAEEAAVEVDVFAAGEVGMEAGANLEERADAAEDVGPAGGGLRDAREDFSSVLLPAPLRPMIPRTSPRFTSKETSTSARDLVELSAAAEPSRPGSSRLWRAEWQAGPAP